VERTFAARRSNDRDADKAPIRCKCEKHMASIIAPVGTAGSGHSLRARNNWVDFFEADFGSIFPLGKHAKLMSGGITVDRSGCESSPLAYRYWILGRERQNWSINGDVVGSQMVIETDSGAGFICWVRRVFPSRFEALSRTQIWIRGACELSSLSATHVLSKFTG